MQQQPTNMLFEFDKGVLGLMLAARRLWAATQAPFEWSVTTATPRIVNIFLWHYCQQTWCWYCKRSWNCHNDLKGTASIRKIHQLQLSIYPSRIKYTISNHRISNPNSTRGIGTDAGSETTLSRNSSTILMISNNQFPPWYRIIFRHYCRWSSTIQIPSHSHIFHRTFARHNALLYIRDEYQDENSGDETHGVTVSIADRWRYIPRWWVVLLRMYRVLEGAGVTMWIYI